MKIYMYTNMIAPRAGIRGPGPGPGPGPGLRDPGRGPGPGPGPDPGPRQPVGWDPGQ